VKAFPVWTSHALSLPQFSVKSVIGGFAQRICGMTCGTPARLSPETKAAKADLARFAPAAE
jgi:hypothetical protein